MSRFFNLWFLFLIFFFSHGLMVQAQSSVGISLHPATIEETMNLGQSKKFTITVNNLSDQDQSYYLYKRDIVGASDSGVPIFAEENIDRTEFGASLWVVFETVTIDIPAHGNTSFSFTITVPNDASTGTHFAGIFVSRQSQKLQQSGVAVGYDVANIISIRVAGEVEEKATIRHFSTDNYIYDTPEVTFNIKIENNGNTLLRPTGPLIINNMFGKQVGMVIFNSSLAGIFPGSTREFEVNWVKEDLGLGSYEAIISFSFGEDGYKQTISNSVTFLVLPMNIIIPVLSFLLMLLIVTYFIIKNYTDRELALHTAIIGNRRLVRSRHSGSWIALFSLAITFLIIIIFLILLLVVFAKWL